MIGIIGKKLGMTQVFNEQGQQIPSRVIEAAAEPVLKVTDKARRATRVELGYGQQRTRARRRRARRRRGAVARRARRSATRRRRGSTTRRACCAAFRLDDAPGKKREIPTYKVGDRS